MIKTIFTSLITLSLLFACNGNKFNVDAERVDANTKIPVGWGFGSDSMQREAYSIVLDSSDKKDGAHSILIKKIGEQSEYGSIIYNIWKKFEGTKISLKGLIKTTDVKGFAGLWMRLDGEAGNVGFDNMMKENIHGTNDWKEFSITLPYDSERVKSIHIGGLLAGSGAARFDNLRLFIDEKPIGQVKEVIANSSKADLDTAFRGSSRIKSVKISPQVLSNLYITGQIWSFLKYHHPSVSNGDYNWDAELFRILPRIIQAKDNSDLSRALEKYLDLMPVPSSCDTCESISAGQALMPADYGDLFNPKILSVSLISKLNKIKEAQRPLSHYYIGFKQGIGNPIFKNENAYAQEVYPDLGYRLLCLYRYWAIINYFFPYKNQIGVEWKQVLKSSIPEFIKATDQKSYTLCVLKLIAKIHDTHANIWGGNKILEEFKGKYTAPFEGTFIAGSLVVTDYVADTLSVKHKFKKGDVILSINGTKVSQLVEKFLPYTPASNRETQMRDLPWNYLLRSNSNIFKFKIQRGTKVIDTLMIPGIGVQMLYKKMYNGNTEGYKLLAEDIGYIDVGGYKNSQLANIQTLFKNAKGLIIDMRRYPAEFLPFTLGSYIKQASSPFVKFSTTSTAHPGMFEYTLPIYNGGQKLSSDNFNRNVVVIVNSSTQSRGEYTTMAFQSSPNVKVLGSTTAGADGDVSSFYLPGGISTMISGIGIFYPDNTATQRTGVKIDYKIKPTIEGVKAGRDELLEKAKELIRLGNY